MGDTTDAKRLRQGSLARLLVGAVVFLVLYLGVIALTIAADTEPEVGSQVVPDDSAVVVLTMQNLNTLTGTASVEVSLAAGSGLVDEQTKLLRSDVAISLPSLAGSIDSGSPGQPAGLTVTYAGGTLPAAQTVSLAIDGDASTWPLDRYELAGSVAVYRYAYPAGADSDPTLVPVPTGVTVEGALYGWTATGEGRDGGAAAPDSVALTIEFRRVNATVAMSVLLVAILIVLPVLGWAIALSVYRRRRRLEPAFSTFLAAMLFAIVPLRGLFPGSPPLGAWVDILVVFWVIVALVGATAVFIGSWLRDAGPPPPRGT